MVNHAMMWVFFVFALKMLDLHTVPALGQPTGDGYDPRNVAPQYHAFVKRQITEQEDGDDTFDFIELGDDEYHIWARVRHEAEAAKNRSKTQAMLRCLRHKDACCLVRFYINFADVGWNDTVVEPKGYYGNYCRGGCHGREDRFRFRKTDATATALQKTLENKYNSTTRRQYCVTTRYRPLEIVFRNATGSLANATLPIIIAGCGCYNGN